MDSPVPKRRGVLLLLIGLLLGGAAGAGTMYWIKRDKKGGPNPKLGVANEIAMIPADSIGFVHLRARDVWKSEQFAEVRKIIEKAGPDVLAALDENFVPAPSSLDHLTLVLMKNPDADPVPSSRKQLIQMPEGIEPVGVLSFTEKYDAAKVRASVIPDARMIRIGGKEYWQDQRRDLAAYFPSDTVLVIGTAVGVSEFVKKQRDDGKPSEGPLARALALTKEGGRHFVAAVNIKHFGVNVDALGRMLPEAGVGPSEALQLARDAAPLLKAEAFAVDIALGSNDAKFEIRAYFKDDSDAVEGEKAVLTVADFAHKKLEVPRAELEMKIKGQPGMPRPRPVQDLPIAIGSVVGLGALNTIDGYLTNPPLKRDGAELIVTFDGSSIGSAYVGAAAVGVGLLLPAVQKVREAAARMSSSNNLKQIALACMNYESAYGHLPNDITDANGKPILSWRVAILPFIEQGNLYNQFNLTEPWDSPNNKHLSKTMIKTYVSPQGGGGNLAGKTHYQGFVGPDTLFEPGKKIKLTDITDGTSNTILVVETADAVDWAKPGGIPFDQKKALPTLSSITENGIVQVALCDGSVRSLNLKTVREQTIKDAITKSDGNVLGLDW
jgi:hypothetical protein